MVADPQDHRSSVDGELLFGAEITAGQLPVVRQQVEAVAHRCGLTAEQVSDWVTAVNELMTNAVRHGGGAGRLRVWEDDGLVCEIRDKGPGFSSADYVDARERPPLSTTGGLGLWIVQQMTDELRIDSTPAGTVVRISVAMPDPR